MDENKTYKADEILEYWVGGHPLHNGVLLPGNATQEQLIDYVYRANYVIDSLWGSARYLEDLATEAANN